jgi:hypothetical protein
MLEINDGYWKLDGKDMPNVTQSAHIGIQKSETNSTQSTVTENIRKATRALCSLMMFNCSKILPVGNNISSP